MAGEDRTTSRAVSLRRALRQDVHAFDFFQALRRLECANPAAPRIGLSERPTHDPLRLGQDPSLAFAASTLARLEPGQDGAPDRLVVNFFGMLGPNGPLPLHLTAYAWDHQHNQSDPTLAHFLDVFHHRMLSLFYRAWAINRPTVSFDRPDEDRFATYVASLFGLGQATLRQRDALPDLARLSFAGHLACQSRHPDGLQAMIGDYFRIPAQIREFIGEWVALPEDSRCCPGLRPRTAILGETAVLGFRMWGAQHRFRIVLGPLGFADFQRFLPKQPGLARLTAMVRFYAGDALAWEVMPVLERTQVPKLQPNGQFRLGLTTWLVAENRESDADDLILQPELAAATAAPAG